MTDDDRAAAVALIAEKTGLSPEHITACLTDPPEVPPCPH